MLFRSKRNILPIECFYLHVFLSVSANAQESFSSVLAKDGLAGTAVWLKSQPKTPENKFLLSGIEALSAIEFILQVRYE